MIKRYKLAAQKAREHRLANNCISVEIGGRIYQIYTTSHDDLMEIPPEVREAFQQYVDSRVNKSSSLTHIGLEIEETRGM